MRTFRILPELTNTATTRGTSHLGELGAVFRTVLETTRTLFVWIVRACADLIHFACCIVFRMLCTLPFAL